MAVVWKPVVYGPSVNNANYLAQWDGANTGVLKDGLPVVTTIGATGEDTNIPSEQAVREAIAPCIQANSGTSTGTGSEQTIAHGLGVEPTRVYAYPTEDPAGTVFTWGTPGKDATNIYITVTTGKDFTWVAESW
jgi:hypothetical protein